MKLVQLIILTVISCNVIDAANVLMVLPLGSKSHKNIFIPLAESLSTRGHKVVIASLYSNSVNNSTLPYEDAVAYTAFETIKTVTGNFDVFKMRKANGEKNVNSQIMKKVVKNIGEYCEAFLKDPSLHNVWKFKPDVVLLPAFMNECGLAFVHKFKAPFIYVTTSGLTPWTSDLIGNPEHPAYVPNQYLPYPSDMNLWQRTVNTVMRVVAPVLRKNIILGRLENTIQKVLGDSSVSISSLERNVSMVLVNSHHSMGTPRPLLPNVVEIGGMHCRPAKSIANSDPELNAFISRGNGAILFSLGSHIKSSQIPLDVQNILKKAFARLPYQVVWKWEGNPPKDLPKNVITRHWVPQQDLLGHPSMKAFLTHGGLLSIQEAIYHGVPIVGIPIMSDQHLNVKQIENLGVGKSLTLELMTEKSLVKTLREVIEVKSYSEKAHERSMIMKDQETTPLNRAIYWTEYVIRHGGAEHLKSNATRLSFTQYYLIDVIVVLLVSLILALLVMFYSLKATFRGIKSVGKSMLKKLSIEIQRMIVIQYNSKLE